jgi:hypothetical protein
LSTLPKLRITRWNGEQVVQNIEDWKDFPFAIDDLVMVEGQEIYSYEDLLTLVKQEPYRNQQYLDMRIMPFIAGG